ncbi:hypothetical protein C8F01DRAFT_1079735 [Mycena amicta]|nr:hypothetical protein C8F01DRAFT_1079735 [Mycena amicta]
MGRTALHLTQADRKRAARERVVKYNKSARGKASRSAQRQQRHARKLQGSVLGKLPVDDTGFLDGYSADYDILNGRFRAWARFPVFPPPPSDVGINPDSAEYHDETRLIEAVLHGDYRKREQVHELELTQQVADMDPKLRVTSFVQWLLPPPPPPQACREGFGRREQRERFWLDAQPLLATAKRTRRSCERKLGSGWHGSFPVVYHSAD